MREWIPYMIVPMAYLVLFAVSRGAFRASAGFLLRHIRRLAEYTNAGTLARALVIFLAADLLAACSAWQAKQSDTAASGYLVREEYGGSDEEYALTATIGEGEEQEVKVDVAARKLAAEEVETALSDAADHLAEEVLGKGGDEYAVSPDHVDRDLVLPSAVGDPAVQIVWYSDRPDVLSDEGEIAESFADPAGAEVTLDAELSLEDSMREQTFHVTVYPKVWDVSEATGRELTKAVSDANDETESTVMLPTEFDGRPVSWKTASGSSGTLILLMGGLIAAFYVYSRTRLREIAEEKRKESLKADYPDLVLKLVLLLSAGMSLRGAFLKISEDYKKGLSEGGEVRPAFDEVCLTVRDMSQGVTEAAAYEELGRRCDIPIYRTFATLLVQNLQKGGPGMRMILEREAAEALEERKRNARSRGEDAGTKLLLPMLLMLTVIMAVLVIPSFLTFF